MTAMNKTATLAAQLSKKPTRRVAFDHIEALIKQGDLSPEHAAPLYAFFMPAPTRAPKTVFDWVWLAVARNDPRKCLNFAYSDGEYLNGTDGYRLHRAPTDLPQGFYDQTGTKVDITFDRPYPDVARVLRVEGSAPVAADRLAFPVEAMGAKLQAYSLPGGGLANKTYMDDALSMGAGELVSRGDRRDSTHRLDFGDGRVAIIMGLRG